MRLDKFLTHSTELTRSQAKRVLRLGEVTVNGDVCKDAARNVQTSDTVGWQGTLLEQVGNRYLMLNKPDGVECTLTPEFYPTVLSLIDIEQRDRLRIVGRLDVDTTGLLLISDDGQWSHRVSSPNHHCIKRYCAELEVPIEDTEWHSIEQAFTNGIQLNGEESLTKPAKITRVTATSVRIEISEGRYHQVKRMMAAVGHSVVALNREAIGDLELDPNLELGECRFLTAEEIALF